MKETPLSICERRFIQEAIAEGKRLDDRDISESREVTIQFGNDFGCCLARLGNTKTLSQVSCTITTPKAHRPSEGVLRVNVEFSPMGSPSFEPGRFYDYGVEVSRLLEKCVRDSRCLDLESLCIVSGEKVWSIRVDIHILNHDGNLVECASIAAIASLAHFKRPDVSVVGTDVTVYTIEERDPVPLSIHHWPICVCFALFQNQGKEIVSDPTDAEEKVAEGKITVAANAHNEVCALHIEGNVILQKDQILRCSSRATTRAKELTEQIKRCLEEDAKAKKTGETTGFRRYISQETEMIKQVSIVVQKLSHTEDTDLRNAMPNTETPKVSQTKENAKMFLLNASQQATVGEGGPSKWDIKEDGKSSSFNEMAKQALQEAMKSEDSESDEESEEEPVILESNEFVKKSESVSEGKNRKWYDKHAFI